MINLSSGKLTQIKEGNKVRHKTAGILFSSSRTRVLCNVQLDGGWNDRDIMFFFLFLLVREELGSAERTEKLERW